jgi:hypothetical protein
MNPQNSDRAKISVQLTEPYRRRQHPTKLERKPNTPNDYFCLKPIHQRDALIREPSQIHIHNIPTKVKQKVDVTFRRMTSQASLSDSNNDCQQHVLKPVGSSLLKLTNKKSDRHNKSLERSQNSDLASIFTSSVQ